MKIPLTSGGLVDTDKMNDRDASMNEAINNFYLTCEKFNVTGFAKVILKENEGLGCLYLPLDNDELRSQEYSKLVSSIAEWLERTSNGRLIVVDTENQEDSAPEIPEQE
jgi:hypothetical protein